MYDQRVTIEEAVNHIQTENYLLPAIQREIVWERDQITDLFDSVLQGYPIGTFLYWDIEEDNYDEYTMYGFIKHYITSTKYFDTDAQTRNSKVKPDGVGDLKLILDGQQRLSSFFIGLKGTYTYKQPYKYFTNPDAWNRCRLYFKLTSDPWTQVESGGDRQTRYEFSFLPVGSYNERLVQRGDDYWFRVGGILDYPESRDIGKYINEKKKGIDLNPEEENWLDQNLRDLRTAIHDKKYVTYFEEKEQNIDRVLEVFIRTNDGGTQLTKSDLLLSIAQANWTEYDAREELTKFVDHLNNQLPSTNNYDKDFLLKSCLVLTDLPVRYRVGQFKRENVSKIENQWQDIKDAIREAATLVNHFGIDESTLLSRNAVIPLAYYFKHNGLTAVAFQTDETELFETKQKIKRWFITSLLHGTLSGSADTVLNRTREILREQEGTEFPIHEIQDEITSLGKVVGFNEEIAENVLEYQKGGKRTFLALTLLYEQDDFGSIQHHQDHIFPASRITIDNLTDHGMDPEKASRLADRADNFANLQLLTRKENESKQDTPFEEWLTTQSEKFYERHLIPTDEDLHRLENFDRFLEARGNRIKDELISTLSTPQISFE